jgi:hypothetical protein
VAGKKGEEMKYCKIVEGPRYARDSMWCLDHNLPADHCGPDGNTPVCKIFAVTEGCNCCSENYNKGEENAKLYKLAWDLLTDEHQENVRKMLELIEKGKEKD